MSDSNAKWNFGRNVCLKPQHFYQPKSTDELLTILDRHRDQKIRAIGSLHAWSDAAQSSGVIIETQFLNEIQVDSKSETVTVGGGCKVKHLLAALAEYNLTLPSVGLIDEQTVAGATSTATHGSGNHSLSHFIQAVEIAHFDDQTGQPKLSRIDSGAELEAARCAIGLLGVVTKITFHCRPRYNVQEHSTAHASLSDVLDQETEFPLQQFYLMPWSWVYFGHHRVETERPRSRLRRVYRWYCFTVIDVGLHVVMFLLAKILKQAWAIRFFFKRVLPFTILRQWKVVDDSHAMLTMEHELFRHIEIEVFVQRSKLQATVDFLSDVVKLCGRNESNDRQSMQPWMEQLGDHQDLSERQGQYVHHYPICFRRIRCDDALMSMAAPSDSNEDWFAISFISYQWPSERDGFFKFANFIGPAIAKLFDGRCHWGKYNPLDRDTNERLYPRIKEFREIVDRYDPQGNFKNDWLEQSL